MLMSSLPPPPQLEWLKLPGLTDYAPCLELMLLKTQEVISNPLKAFVMLLEHPHLYTLGSSASQDDLIGLSDVPIFHTDRGGKATYHGPGQLIIYPIFHLSYFDHDIKKYVHFLMQVLVETFLEIGLKATACSQKIGIWTKISGANYKLASIGIRVKKWVAYHGVSVNLAPDLAKFANIVACGLKGVGQTSLQKLGYNADSDNFIDIFKSKFAARLAAFLGSSSIDLN